MISQLESIYFLKSERDTVINLKFRNGKFYKNIIFLIFKLFSKRY